MKKQPKCQCGHLKDKHFVGAGQSAGDCDGRDRCLAKRSVPGGRVYPCGCESFRPRTGNKQKDVDACSEACDRNRCVHDVTRAVVAFSDRVRVGLVAMLQVDLIEPATYRAVLELLSVTPSPNGIKQGRH